jgi:hypothetical protein
MGLNFNLVNFLLSQQVFTQNFQHPKKILEIGVLKNSLSFKQKHHLAKKYNIPLDLLHANAHEIYNFFGYSEITSLDNHAFEKAGFIKNLNIQPSKEDDSFKDTYDLILDGGTSEHVYNPLIAFANYLNYLKIDGTLIQFLPINNYIDHGIYQFSPTFFWSIDSQHFKSVKLQALHFRSHGARVNNYHYDGNSNFFRAHIDGLWNGSTAANLFRFTQSDIIGLANWTKKTQVNYENLIFQTNQEIYRNQWRNYSPRHQFKHGKFDSRIFRMLFRYERTIISIFIAKLVLLKNRSYD